MTGPSTVLVEQSSATHTRPWENDAHHVQAIDRNHSDMVKFNHGYDPDLERVATILREFVNGASSMIGPRGNSDQGNLGQHSTYIPYTFIIAASISYDSVMANMSCISNQASKNLRCLTLL